MRVIIKKSTNPKKKYMAIFYNGKDKIKTVQLTCKDDYPILQLPHNPLITRFACCILKLVGNSICGIF